MRKASVTLSQWHVKGFLSQQRPPRGFWFRSEGIPENNSNHTLSPSCGEGGHHNHRSIKTNQLKRKQQQPVGSLLTAHFTHISTESNYTFKQVFPYKTHTYCKKINNQWVRPLNAHRPAHVYVKTKKTHSLTLGAFAANTTGNQPQVQSADDVTIISPQLEAPLHSFTQDIYTRQTAGSARADTPDSTGSSLGDEFPLSVAL